MTILTAAWEQSIINQISQRLSLPHPYPLNHAYRKECIWERDRAQLSSHTLGHQRGKRSRRLFKENYLKEGENSVCTAVHENNRLHELSRNNQQRGSLHKLSAKRILFCTWLDRREMKLFSPGDVCKFLGIFGWLKFFEAGDSAGMLALVCTTGSKFPASSLCASRAGTREHISKPGQVNGQSCNNALFRWNYSRVSKNNHPMRKLAQIFHQKIIYWTAGASKTTHESFVFYVCSLLLN